MKVDIDNIEKMDMAMFNKTLLIRSGSWLYLAHEPLFVDLYSLEGVDQLYLSVFSSMEGFSFHKSSCSPFLLTSVF